MERHSSKDKNKQIALGVLLAIALSFTGNLYTEILSDFTLLLCELGDNIH